MIEATRREFLAVSSSAAVIAGADRLESRRLAVASYPRDLGGAGRQPVRSGHLGEVDFFVTDEIAIPALRDIGSGEDVQVVEVGAS